MTATMPNLALNLSAGPSSAGGKRGSDSNGSSNAFNVDHSNWVINVRSPGASTSTSSASSAGAGRSAGALEGVISFVKENALMIALGVFVAWKMR